MSQEKSLMANIIAFIWPLYSKYDSQSLYCVTDLCAHLGWLESLSFLVCQNMKCLPVCVDTEDDGLVF